MKLRTLVFFAAAAALAASEAALWQQLLDQARAQSRLSSALNTHVQATSRRRPPLFPSVPSFPVNGATKLDPPDLDRYPGDSHFVEPRPAVDPALEREVDGG